MSIDELIEKLQEMKKHYPDAEIVREIADSERFMSTLFVDSVVMYLHSTQSVFESDVYYKYKPTNLETTPVKVIRID